MGMFEGAEGQKQKLEEKIGAPVVAVCYVQPRGAVGGGFASIGLSKVSPLGSMIFNKSRGSKANEKSGGLGKIGLVSTKAAILAATADKLYAFEMKTGWGGLKVKDPIAQWERKDVKVTPGEPGSMTTPIDIDIASSGEHMEVEATTAMGAGKIVDEFLAEMT
jgi:hypothetical protein